MLQDVYDSEKNDILSSNSSSSSSSSFSSSSSPSIQQQINDLAAEAKTVKDNVKDYYNHPLYISLSKQIELLREKENLTLKATGLFLLPVPALSLFVLCSATPSTGQSSSSMSSSSSRANSTQISVASEAVSCFLFLFALLILQQNPFTEISCLWDYFKHRFNDIVNSKFQQQQQRYNSLQPTEQMVRKPTSQSSGPLRLRRNHQQHR
jgi:hypothetical protein